MKKAQQLVHFVFTGGKFHYYYYIGLMTALKVYRKKVRLWITEEPDSKYFSALKSKVKIEKIRAKDIPDFPALRGKDDHFKRVAIFDYLIWNIVYKYGGIIMGLDSITLKSHFDLLEEGKEIMMPRDREDNPESYAMHGVIVRKGSNLTRQIIKLAREFLDSSDIKWGESGTQYSIIKQNLDKVSIAPVGLCAGGDTYGFLVFMDDAIPHPDVRTIPLAGRSSFPVEVILDERYVAVAKSLYARLIKKMLSEEEWKMIEKDGEIGGIKCQDATL